MYLDTDTPRMYRDKKARIPYLGDDPPAWSFIGHGRTDETGPARLWATMRHDNDMYSLTQAMGTDSRGSYMRIQG